MLGIRLISRFPKHLQNFTKFRHHTCFIRNSQRFVSKETVTMTETSSETPYSGFKQPWLQLDSKSAHNGPSNTEIIGQIPTWLEGSLYRNGSGIFMIGESRLRHLFDGFAVIHRFDLHQGQVTYTSRVLDSDSWQRSVKANRLVTTQFGTYAYPDPCKTLYSRIMSYFKPRWQDRTDNTAVNIVEHGDRLYTMTETPVLLTVDPSSLQVTHKDNLDRVVAVHVATAHPHFDRDGNMYNLGTAFNPPNNYNIVKIPPPTSKDDDALGTASLLTSLSSQWKFSMGYNHSFGMSRDHFIILEQPITMNSLKFLTSNWRRASVFENFEKHPGKELIFRLVTRSDGKEVPIQYRAETTFTFHFVNCYEEKKELIVDFIGYSDCDVFDDLYVDALDENGKVSRHPSFRRYVLPLSLEQAVPGQNLVKFSNTTATAVLRSDGSVFLTPDLIIKEGSLMELPRINYDMVNGEQYKYVYGTSLFSEKPQLKKLDLIKREELIWEEEGYQPGEPVFVSRPGATEEDDGVVLSPVLSRHEGKSCFLLVLDARTFTELGRAVTPPTMKWAMSFHGTYRAQSK